MEDIKKKTRRWPGVLRGIFLGIIIVLILLNLVYVAYCSFFVKPGNIPSVAGYGVATDQTQVMAPDVPKGSMLVVRTSPAEYAKGNVVVYTSTDGRTALVGRISGVKKTGEENTYIIETNRGAQDSVTSDRLRGLVTHKILYVGYYLDFIMTASGAAFCIILPCALIIVYELIRILVYVRQSKRAAVSANTSKPSLERENGELFPEIAFVPKTMEHSQVKPDGKSVGIPLQFGGIPILEEEEDLPADELVNEAIETPSSPPVTPEQPAEIPQESPMSFPQPAVPLQPQSSAVSQGVDNSITQPVVPAPEAIEQPQEVLQQPVNAEPPVPPAPVEEPALEKENQLEKALNGSRIPSDILELLHSLEESSMGESSKTDIVDKI